MIIYIRYELMYLEINYFFIFFFDISRNVISKHIMCNYFNNL